MRTVTTHYEHSERAIGTDAHGRMVIIETSNETWRNLPDRHKEAKGWRRHKRREKASTRNS